MDPEGLALFAERFERLYSGERISPDAQYRVRRKDGVWIDTEIKIGSVTYDNGMPSTLVVVANEITERKKAEEILKRDKVMLEQLVNYQADQMVKARMLVEKSKRLADIGRLASTIAHELRNPLAAIKTAAFNIQRKAANPGLDKHVETINKKVAESDLIIENVLNFGKTKVPKFEQIKVRDIINENISAVLDKYKDWNVEVKQDIQCPDGVMIEADSGQLAAVLSNILDNAFQSLPDKRGIIEVSSGLDGDTFLHLQIKDNGSGIPQAVINKIFEPFFTTKPRGTGLGLTVCREIINQHRGKLDISSIEGRGTSVMISLPVRQPEPLNP